MSTNNRSPANTDLSPVRPLFTFFSIICILLGGCLGLGAAMGIYHMITGRYRPFNSSSSQMGDNQYGLNIEIAMEGGDSVMELSVLVVIASGLIALGVLLFREQFSLRTLLVAVFLVAMLGFLTGLLPERPAKATVVFQPMSDCDAVDQVSRSLRVERVTPLLNPRLAAEAQLARWVFDLRTLPGDNGKARLMLDISAPGELRFETLKETASLYMLYLGFVLHERIRLKQNGMMDDRPPSVTGGTGWLPDGEMRAKCYDAAKRDAALSP